MSGEPLTPGTGLAARPVVPSMDPAPVSGVLAAWRGSRWTKRGAGDPDDAWEGSFGTHRVLTAIAACGLFTAAFDTWSAIVQIPLLGVVSVLSFGAALAALILCLLCRNEASLARLDVLVLILAVVLLGAWAASQLYFAPAYGTDEAAFEQFAAQLVVHGQNPYTHSMLPALTEFRVPIQYATYTLGGTVSSAMAYPALSFLLGVPFLWITHGVQSVIVGNVVFLAIQMVLLFLFLPRQIRVLGPIIAMGLPILFGYTLSGVNDTVLAAFLLVVAWRWTDVGRSGRLGAGGISRAVCLGLALSVQQLAWFMLPFAIMGLFLLRRHDLGGQRAALVTGRYTAIAGAVFLAINGPFMVLGFRSWLDGIVTPFTQHAIPYGQGLIDATVFFRIGGGNLAYYTYAAVLLFLGLLVVYWIFFDRMWRLTFVLPCVALFFPTRSLAEYFMTVIGVWAVSIANPGRGPVGETVAPQRSLIVPLRGLRHPMGRHWVWSSVVTCVCFVPGTLLVVLALATPAPLAMHIRSVETNGQLQGAWRIRLDVSNRSGTSLSPHFAANYFGQITSFWYIISGPKTLTAGHDGRYVIAAPNVGSMPGVTQPFILQALTAGPDTLSSSSLYVPQHFTTFISPSYVDRRIPLGGSLTLEVQLRSPLGGFVHQSNVRVALGQLIYGQKALIPSEAQINDGQQGQTPVFALTDSSGAAYFRVRDSSVQGGNPVYFQAYVYPRKGYTYGYSEIVSVLWG